MPLPVRSRRSASFTTLSLGAVVLAALISGCSAPEQPVAVEAPSATASSSTPPHWAYVGEAGPDHWGELASEFSTCATGTSQSPINLPSDAAAEADDLVLTYSPVGEEATDTGHTLQLDAQPGAGLTYNGVEYTLQQMHYHDPSEHTVDGSAAPVEFHFVHKDAEGNLLVIGVLGVAGEENPAFDPLIDAARAGGTPESATIDVQSMMPSSLQHFAYTGSLTTPPCSEGVQWLVMQAPVEVSQEQIDTLTGLYEGNNRPAQPLNERAVHVGGQ